MGVELEFSNLTPLEAANLVCRLFGGKVVQQNHFAYSVIETAHGTFTVELDSGILKHELFKPVLRSMGLSDAIINSETINESLRKLFATVVPCEIVSPPLKISELEAVSALCEALRTAGAKGTSESWLYAFGLHFNIEIAQHSADYYLAILQSFLLQYERLKELLCPDFSRRVTKYIAPFPELYLKHTLRSDYSPSLSELVNDYLDYSPSRNRPLDLLPLFFLEMPEVVEPRLTDQTRLIKARPAFHFRLPNCAIDELNWSPADAWNTWVGIEALAADTEKLACAVSRYERAGELQTNFLNDVK